jgi:hypothetical protein
MRGTRNPKAAGSLYPHRERRQGVAKARERTTLKSARHGVDAEVQARWQGQLPEHRPAAMAANSTRTCAEFALARACTRPILVATGA